MIERYTIKFGPAVSQKELEKALHQDGGLPPGEYADKLKKVKARLEVIGDFEDLKKVSDFLKELARS
jgi:hypothetical protein